MATAFGLFIAIVVACAFIQLPYYRFAPGKLYPTQAAITVSGAQTYRDNGEIDYTTISSKKVSILEAGLARFDPALELVDAALVDGTGTPDETRHLNLGMMADSKQTAEVVALRTLGYPIDVVGTGAVVKSVGDGLPAAKVLHINDTMVAIDGRRINTAEDAIEGIGRHKPGDTVTIDVEPPPNIDTAEAPAPRQETVVLAARASDATRPLLGVDLGTRNMQFKLPFTIDIDSKAVGGPSAGLAFTLGIIDVLTPGSLTGGNHVAVTGTMDLNGKVGPIGGIQQKTFLAQRAGITLFIVPNEELSGAQQFAGTDMRVVGVGTIDEALKALADNGGSTEAVQQAAAAHTTGTPGN